MIETMLFCVWHATATPAMADYLWGGDSLCATHLALARQIPRLEKRSFPIAPGCEHAVMERMTEKVPGDDPLGRFITFFRCRACGWRQP